MIATGELDFPPVNRSLIGIHVVVWPWVVHIAANGLEPKRVPSEIFLAIGEESLHMKPRQYTTEGALVPVNRAQHLKRVVDEKGAIVEAVEVDTPDAVLD